MAYPIRADIIPLFRHLTDAIRPFADAHSVALHFECELETLVFSYHPKELLSDLSQLLCQVITYTPQSYAVQLEVTLMEGYLQIHITNTGVNLAHLDNIHQGLNLPASVVDLEQGGACFEMKLPLEKAETLGGLQKTTKAEAVYEMPIFYQKLRKSLQFYHTDIRNLEQTAAARNQQDGVFLQKVNALIMAHLSRDSFDIDTLSKGLALSRSQLYRRLKALIRLSPAQYSRFIRLRKAKELLETTEMTIGEVAFQVGFVDKSHFTRVFKKQFGFNPSYLRKSPGKDVT